MKIIQKIKVHKLPFVIVAVYLGLLVLMPDKGLLAIKNSSYYLIEMLQIMPVIFLLTVAIDVLVPKAWIIKNFGEGTGIKGSIMALVLGSISAGPIYAAFPIGKMLMKKGAGVGNIVIVLSAWAVIKVPMLANEAKFLGAPFMAARWVLTVVAIFIMGWLAEKFLKREEVLEADGHVAESGLEVSSVYCVGCGLCVKMAPEIYRMDEGKATLVKDFHGHHLKELMEATVEKCPVGAISYNRL